ncbi:MAG TPA: FkbM family methyltransferase [Magnetospirillaceae bacterium]|jgi:FkbM family methyltransferase
MSTQASIISEGKQVLRSVCPQFVLNWREQNYYARFGEVELHFVEFLCRDGQDAVDVGANDGCYIHFMKRYAKHVRAFEPLPWLAEALHHKFDGADNVDIQEIALSDHPGTTTLYIPTVDGVAVTGCSTISQDASAFYAGHQILSVEMQRMDNLSLPPVGFIKIDVEGHEEGVIEGGKRTISANRPRMLVELIDHLAPGCIERVVTLFRNLGYSAFFIYRGDLLPAEQFDIATHQNHANVPSLTATLENRERFGNYIYNFIFIPREEVELVANKIQHRLPML